MEPELWTAVLNTLQICGLVCLLAVPIGTALAILLIRTNVFGRGLAWLCVSSQIAVPLYVFAGGWCAAFGTQGWVPAIAPFLSVGTDSTGSLLAVALVHAAASVSWVSLIVSLGLLWTDRNEEETATVEGGNWQQVRHSILPRLKIWILASCLWCCFPVLTEMVVTNLYQVPSLAELIYLDASLGTITPWTYITGGLLCTLPLMLAAVMWVQTAPPMETVLNRASHFSAITIQLGGLRSMLSGILWSVLLLLAGMPTFSLIAKAGWTPTVQQNGLTSYGWTAERFGETVVEGVTLFRPEYYWSFLIGVSAASFALLGALVLFRLQLRLPRLQFAIQFTALLAMCTPGPLVGIMLVKLLNRSQPEWLGTIYDQTIVAPVLAQQFRLLPLALLLVHSIAFGVDRQTREQLRMDGNTGLLQSTIALWPQLWRRASAAWVILFALSVGSLSCSILVLPPGVTTVAMRLFEMLHFGMRHQDSALCGGLILLGWAISLLLRKTLSVR